MGTKRGIRDNNLEFRPTEANSWDMSGISDIEADIRQRRGGLIPARQADRPLIEAFLQEKQQGLMSKEKEKMLKTLNPSFAPLLDSVRANPRREILKSTFGVRPAPLAVDPLKAFAKPDEAITRLLGAGDIEGAKALQGLFGSQSSEKNITSIQLGLRAEGQTTGDPRIDSLTPQVAANVLARTTPPVAVQTGTGTQLFSRGQVPGGTTSIAPGAAAPSTIPGFVKHTISPQQAESMINKEGEHPPLDVSLEEAQKAGFRTLGSNEQQLLRSFGSATAVVNQLRNLSDGLRVKTDEGVLARLGRGVKSETQAFLQTNPDAAAYQDLRKGTLAPLIRSMGEKGNLAEGDIQRAIDLVPNFWDSTEVADRKWGALNNILSGWMSKSIKEFSAPAGPGPRPRSVPTSVLNDTEQRRLEALRKRHGR